MQSNNQKNDELPNIIRVKHDKENPYVMLNKKALWDSNLSLEAIGLWARLLSRPDHWQIHISELITSSGCGRDKIRRIINELQEQGYLHRIKVRSKEGKFTSDEYFIFESKWTKDEIEKNFPETDFQAMDPEGKPGTENPAPVNRPLVNTDSLVCNEGSEEDPPQKIKANPKKKEITQSEEILTFGDYVKLKKKSYEDLCNEYGASNIEYYINAINNWVPNNRAYKDYAAAIRQWLLKDQKDGKFKNKSFSFGTNLSSSTEENKKYAEKLERHLAPRSNCYVYFNATPTEFVHFNSNKDIQEKLSYDCTQDEFKEKVVRSLSRSIPDIKNILYPQQTNKIVGISQLVQQCKVN